MKNFRIVALILLTGMTLSACHTMHGVGEDTSAAGRSIQRAAD